MILSAGLAEAAELLIDITWTAGIATFGEAPQTVGPDHLQELFQHALEQIPKDEVEHTPIFLLATAGMRLLKDYERDNLLAEVCSYARRTTKFLLPECDLNVQVIPGQTEGLYGWIAANYLLGGFNHPEAHSHGKGHHTYGFLDLGGASAQIAFAPNSTEAAKHASDLQLLRMRTLDGIGSEYRVFVTTWLGFGVNQARDTYITNLVESAKAPASREIPDPCLPSGLKTAPEYGGPAPANLVGTGRFKECLAATYPLLGKDEPCVDRPCLFHGSHVPGIDFDVNHFVGVSEYWHTTHEMFEMGHTDKAYDFETYSKRVTQFCEQDWPSIERGLQAHSYGKKADRDTAAAICFKASWLINLLHEGIGIPHSSNSHNTTKTMLGKAKQEGYLEPFQAVNKIDNTEVSWTLGKMVLYAASQIPPASDDTLAVGFGSNEPGIPKDFQFAGGDADPSGDNDSHPPQPTLPPELPPPGTDTNSDSENLPPASSWKPGDILTTSSLSPRRTPGILLILLAAILVLLILLGRDRRKRLFAAFPRPFARRKRDPHSPPLQRPGKRGLSSKILSLGRANPGGGAGPRYERVMEEGDTPHPGEFELGTLTGPSDDDLDGVRTSGSGSRNSASNGRKRGTTPRPRALGTPSGLGLSGVGGGGYFQGVFDGAGGSSKGAAGGGGLGLNIRSESGDRAGMSGSEAVGAGTGHRSRNASPSGGTGRFRTPGLASPGFKESVD